MYDGHGGPGCADFLRDHLHKYIVGDSNFPNNVELAMRNGFMAADKAFLESACQGDVIEDISGSCACCCLFVDGTLYIGNLGDSRAVLSSAKGSAVEDLSHDHKPNTKQENTRITSAGGKIYK